MARFFMAGTNLLGGATAVIRGRDAEHIQVLRIRPGEDVTICDTEGKDYKCRLVRADKEEAELEVIEVRFFDSYKTGKLARSPTGLNFFAQI